MFHNQRAKYMDCVLQVILHTEYPMNRTVNSTLKELSEL